MSIRVPIVFHHEDGKWWAEAPDVPDYVAGADTLDELRALAKEGLEFHLGGRVEVVEIAAFDFKVTNSSDKIQLSTSIRSRPVLFPMELAPVACVIDLGGNVPAGEAVAS